MAIKKVTESNKLNELDSIARDLGFEYVYGGDRFDREDIHSILLSLDPTLEDLAYVRSKSVEYAIDFQQRPDLKGFFEGQANYWCDTEYFKKIKEACEYQPSPMDVSDITLSQQENHKLTEFVKQIHEDFYVESHMNGVILDGEWKDMLFYALPVLNDILDTPYGKVKNSIVGYQLDDKPFESLQPLLRWEACIEAVKASYKNYSLSTNPYLKEWFRLSPTEIANLSNDVVMQYKAVKKLAAEYGYDKTSYDKVTELAARNLHEIGMYNCNLRNPDGTLSFPNVKPVPWSHLTLEQQQERTKDSNRLVSFYIEMKMRMPFSESAKEKKSNGIIR